MMKCKYCGGNLTLEQAYCPHCGRPNEEAAQHVKDMEHYKSNFEDTKSDVYEVAEKNTEIMSHMIIITVLVILCVVVFVVSARSWSIHRGLLQFDAGIRQGSYMKQMEQYRELPEEQKEAILRMEENVKALLQTYFDMTPEEAENFGTMSNAQKILFLEEKGEVMGYGKSEE